MMDYFTAEEWYQKGLQVMQMQGISVQLDPVFMIWKSLWAKLLRCFPSYLSLNIIKWQGLKHFLGQSIA